jgi:membrane protease YdiL (CAAX protease family)
MITATPEKVEQFVAGKKLLIAFGSSVLAAAVVGTVGYFVFHSLLGNPGGTTVAQIVTLQVYMVLLITLCLQFRPVTEPPIALRPSGAEHAIASVGIWIATVAAILLFYFCLGPIFGSVTQVATQITAFATDAKRLQGQPYPAWIIAIVRGCLIVPIFEEVFFRGVLLSWLRKHLNVHGAIFLMATLFALMHGSLAVAPYVFIFAVVTGYVRVRTGSTFNTIIMHSLNNVMLLYVGLRIFGGH